MTDRDDVLAALREVLAFYADETQYDERHYNRAGTLLVSNIEADRGERARALKGAQDRPNRRGSASPTSSSSPAQPKRRQPSTMDKPRLLDLFCGAGGAAKGYQRAGFYVVGVDIKPQPRYAGDEFIQADAMTFALDGFDAIHASPPCQAFSVMRALPQARNHPNLIPDIRERLIEAGVPYVIENVPGAPLINPVTLCGSMFGLRSSPKRYLRRHRLFEINPAPLIVPQCEHRGEAVGVYGHGSAGYLGQRMRTAKADEARQLMGMDWATRDGMTQAIPPAYTEWIGRELMRVIATVETPRESRPPAPPNPPPPDWDMGDESAPDPSDTPPPSASP